MTNQAIQHGAHAHDARIVVIDDHAIVRYGYTQLINHQDGLQVCGTAECEQAGIEIVRRELPDLVIVDLSLKDGHGLDLIDALRKQCREIKLLVISAHDENLYAERSLAAGASGYIQKQEATDRLIAGIRTILDGDLYFSSSVTQRLMRERAGSKRPTSGDAVESLTNRELQVFEWIGKGSGTREIANHLFLSIKTIERHKENIKKKLHLTTATQLVQRATQWVIDRGF